MAQSGAVCRNKLSNRSAEPSERPGRDRGGLVARDTRLAKCPVQAAPPTFATNTRCRDLSDEVDEGQLKSDPYLLTRISHDLDKEPN